MRRQRGAGAAAGGAAAHLDALRGRGDSDLQARGGLQPLGRAKVGQLHHALAADQHVAGLDVAVRHVVLVQVRQTRQHLVCVAPHQHLGQAAEFAEDGLQGATRDPLGENVHCVVHHVGADVLDNVRVVQGAAWGNATRVG